MQMLKYHFQDEFLHYYQQYRSPNASSPNHQSPTWHRMSGDDREGPVLKKNIEHNLQKKCLDRSFVKITMPVSCFMSIFKGFII